MSPEAVAVELERLRAKVVEQEAFNAEVVRGIQIVQQAQVVLGKQVGELLRQLLELVAQQNVDTTRH